jgi:signal transduction histidine kinase
VKSKYILALLLAGIPPLLGLAGVYFWITLTQAPFKTPAVDAAVVQPLLRALKTESDSIASSMFQAIKKTSDDMPNLVAHNTDADLDNFVKSHQGVSGIVIYSMGGKLENNIPASPPLTDATYPSSDEFKKVVEKFQDRGSPTYQFYTQRMGYPAFVFAIPVGSQSFAAVVMNLRNFFRDIDPKSGEIFLLDAGSGHYLYHSNPAKLTAVFNPDQEAWLTKIQTELSNEQGGIAINPPQSGAVYTYLGFGKFGVVHTVPLSALMPSSGPAASKPSLDNLPELIQSNYVPLLAAAAGFGWLLFVGALCYGMILGPLRKAGAVVLNAAQGSGNLPPETAKSFGKDEIGQMVQAVSLLTQKLQQEKQEMTQEKEETLRRGKAEMDSKLKEGMNQVAAAQQQAQSVRAELNDKNQQLNDKLKELDAMKGMQEGLRNQNEQSKSENAKLKGQISEIGQTQADFQKKLVETQGQLKDMEAKMLRAVSAASAIQVSQVRAAAIRTMAEELKTTLGIIKGYVSSALGASSQGGINEKQQEFLGMVINRSARLEKFINDLLDIYQVEIEQQDAKMEEVNLASEIEGLAFNFQAQAEVKNIKMKVEAKGTVPKVPIVRRRFNQLWNILYLQIIKDAPRGSSIPITVEAIGENVKVTVQDPGLTVVPESLPKLFDEFYDPKHPASPQLAGTGLKFALVKTILAAHGGGVVAEKAEPGTRLILNFATKVKKPGAAPVPSMPPSPSVTAAPSIGLKPPGVTMPPAAAPGIKPMPSFGLPKPAVPGAPAAGTPPALGVPKPSPPLGAPSPLGVPKPPAPPSLGVPKPAGLPTPGVAPPPGPKPVPDAGALDALFAGKVPPITAPGIKPPAAPAAPSLGAIPPVTATGGTALGTPPAPNPSAGSGPRPPMPTAPPAAPKPAVPSSPGMSAGGLLDALLEKKIPVPPAPAVGAPKPLASPPSSPGAPPVSRSAAPVMPPMGAPAAPKPPMPTGSLPGGLSSPGIPAAPKVVPTSVKPTTPPPGILDLDNTDSFKVDAGAPNPSTGSGLRTPMPAAPSMGAPKPPMPGAPPSGAPKPTIPPPGVPPGGLNPNKSTPKKEDGELIE